MDKIKKLNKMALDVIVIQIHTLHLLRNSRVS
jgi:hypothetical protein